jgi:hypothetical protein
MGSYKQIVNVAMKSGEVRHLEKVYMGKLDDLAVKTTCRIDTWE